MKKYIDAEGVMRACYDSFLKTGNKAYREIFALMEAVPAADVVEVVRCRECRYREEEQPGMVYCPNTVGGWVDENWFCAGGEKE